MPKFYFTYGTDGQPFRGGWTEIEAPNANAACAVFRIFHPDKREGILDCAWVYSEEKFKRTEMAGPDGNFHQGCHETIILRREAAEN